MIPLPPKVNAGEAVSAAWANALRDAVAALSTISAGDGVAITHGQSGLIIGLLAAGGDWRQGVIAAAPDGPDQVGESIRYDVQIPGLPLETSLAVTLWRPIGGPDVRYIPARVGDPCFVLIRPDGEGSHETFLCCPTEALAPGRCDNTGGTVP